MNEVASFIPGSARGCEQNDLNYPPFTPRKSLVFSCGVEKHRNQNIGELSSNQLKSLNSFSRN